MTEFKTPLLAIALMVVTAGNLSSAAMTSSGRCIQIIKDHYGNGKTLSGVENFQHSFFKKTRQIINNMFKPIVVGQPEPIVGQSEPMVGQPEEENYDEYEEENYDEYAPSDGQPIVGETEEENYDEQEEENYDEDEESSDEYEEEDTDDDIRSLMDTLEDESDESEGDSEEFVIDSEIREQLRLELVMGYYHYLYGDNNIDPKGVLSRTKWCHNQAPLVITYIQMENINIIDGDFKKKKQNRICLRYVKYLDIYKDLNQETFENELEKFYFETTEDMITAEKIYPKTVEVEYETKDNIMFYLKTYTVAYYEQYKKLVNNLVIDENGMFRGVENFCTFNGMDIVDRYASLY